jgi:hypothetical protein
MVQSKNFYQNNWAFDISGKVAATNIDLFETQDEQLPQQTKRVRARGARAISEEPGQAAQS